MYHLRDGIYFNALRDGSGRVEIVVREHAYDNAPVIKHLVIDPGEWASVVASVSARGESGEVYREAMDLHALIRA